MGTVLGQERAVEGKGRNVLVCQSLGTESSIESQNRGEDD